MNSVSNTAYSISGKFVIGSALILSVFVMFVITSAMSNIQVIQEGGDFKVVQAQQVA